jgi:hypothetical protein
MSKALYLTIFGSLTAVTSVISASKGVTAVRFLSDPIVVPAASESLGNNINGPSLIRVPEWVRHPLGRYYLYFAHHGGTFIRLAYSDHLRGPWRSMNPRHYGLIKHHAVTTI